LCQIYRPQTAVQTPHQYQLPGHNPYLWQSSKCYQKGTLGTHGEVLRSWKVSPGLGRGPGEKHSPVREDWGYGGVEIKL